MSDETVAELAAAANRRTKALVWGFYGVTLVGGTALFVVYGVLGLAAAVVWLLAWTVELFELGGRIELLTEKSPATVREEFTGPDVPLFALNRHMADSITDLASGFELVHAKAQSSTRVRFEAADAQAAGGDGVDTDPEAAGEPVRIRVFEDGEHARTVTVTVDPVGGQTRVVASFERRASGLLVLLDRLYRPLERRALAAQGYVLVEDATGPL